MTFFGIVLEISKIIQKFAFQNNKITYLWKSFRFEIVPIFKTFYKPESLVYK